MAFWLSPSQKLTFCYHLAKEGLLLCGTVGRAFKPPRTSFKLNCVKLPVVFFDLHTPEPRHTGYANVRHEHALGGFAREESQS